MNKFDNILNVPIHDYEYFYRINILGEIWSEHSNKLLKPKKHPKGYLYIGLSKNGIKKTYKIHRLVVQHFLSNPNNLPEVNHINGIKNDNRVENLEWISSRDNQLHAYIIGLKRKIMLGKFGKNHPSSKPIIQMDINNNIIKEWECARQIERKLGYKHGYIAQVCTGKYTTAYGFKWKHKN